MMIEKDYGSYKTSFKVLGVMGLLGAFLGGYLWYDAYSGSSIRNLQFQGEYYRLEELISIMTPNNLLAMILDPGTELYVPAFFGVVGIIAGLLINLARSLYRISQNTDAALERRNRKAEKKQEVARIQASYVSRMSALPSHLKVGNALACDNDQQQLFIRKNILGSEKWLCVDYKDIVSWRESFSNEVRVQEALIGQKAVVSEKDNAIVFTVRGPLGPELTLHLNSGDWRQKAFALLSANLS